MRIGIISDSHDNLPKIEKAVRFFNKQRVDFVLHAGDFVAPFTIPKLKSLNADWLGVFGNNDGEIRGLARISQGRIRKGPFKIRLDSKKVILTHDIKTINLDTQDAHLIVFGHSHRPKILKKRNKLLVNPGESCGWLTGKSTVALVDLHTLAAKIYKI